MFPVVRHRAFALTVDAATLYLAPVVVGTPRHTQREALLERGRAGRVVAAEGPADETDSVGVDGVDGLEVVDAGCGPFLGGDLRSESLQAQCFAAAGAVDHQGGDASPGEFVAEAGEVHVFFGAVETVPHDHARHRSVRGLRRVK